MGWGGGHWVGHSRRLAGLMGGVGILMRMWHQLWRDRLRYHVTHHPGHVGRRADQTT